MTQAEKAGLFRGLHHGGRILLPPFFGCPVKMVTLAGETAWAKREQDIMK